MKLRCGKRAPVLTKPGQGAKSGEDSDDVIMFEPIGHATRCAKFTASDDEE